MGRADKPKARGETPEMFAAGPLVSKLREAASTVPDAVWGCFMRESIAATCVVEYPTQAERDAAESMAVDILSGIEKHSPKERNPEAGHMLPTTAALCAALIGGGALLCSALHSLGLM